MLRLVALDLDDTLLCPDGTISGRVKDAVQAVRDLGVLVTLATGRMYCSALPYARQLSLDLPLITYQGALIKTSHTGEVWRLLQIESETLFPLLRFLEQEQVHINLYVGDDLYVAEMNEIADRYARFSRIPVQAVGRLSSFPVPAATKVVVIGDPAFLRQQLQPAAQRLFGGHLTINTSRPHFLEFGHPQATKAQALAHLGAHFHISRHQMMAIGDSENDRDMLEYVGLGVAMGNSEPAVQAIADYVTASNEEDGVALALDKFILQVAENRKGLGNE